jgi:formylglycine-generating enzyme required for sulfatase activity
MLAPLFSIAFVALLSTSASAGEFINHVGMRFADIPAGKFFMGSCKLAESQRDENKKRAFLGLKPLPTDCGTPDLNALDSEIPRHAVSVPAFQMGRTEVSLGQFKQFIAGSGRFNLVNDKFMKANAFGDNAPVVWVNWTDAQAFVNWLNTSKPENDRGTYRLPSEAEWEYACHGGNRFDYCGGNDPNAVAWYFENGGWGPRPVAGKKPNGYGLYDMSGNADEWVQDCYHKDYNGAPNDGSAWTSGCSSSGYVLRSGSWKHYDARYTRSAYRGEGKPDLYNARVGFRVVRSLR